MHQIIPGWGKCYLFKTFEDLDNVKDVEADILAVRKLIDEGSSNVEPGDKS
jgi:hypothetical protein